MTLLNPAKYQQVLQKMPDPQLMQLLKRPDKIPSQFVIQEINRRKQMRQAEQARKQQVANAVAMQQQPVQTTTPEGQPAMGLLHGGPPPHPPINPTLLNELNKFKNPPSFAQFGFPYENFQGNIKPSDIGSFNLGNIGKRPKRNIPYFTSSPQDELSVKVAKAGFNPMSTKGMTAYYAQQDPLEELITEQSDQDTSGIKTIENNTNDNVDNNEPIDKNAIEKGKKSNSQLDKLVASLGDQINDQIAKTKEPFNASSVLEGYKQSEFFDETSEAYKNLNTKSKERIDAANKAGIDLIKERQKYAAQLEKEGRTPENIVFTSLIQMGLSLMASPEANFTQALGQAGQAGFATFQNLRKEQKDLVKEKYKRAYEIAEAEYKHKMSISQLENELDVQKVNAATTINNLARTEKKDFIDQRKIEFEMENLKQGLALEKQKLKLDQTTKGIAAFLSLNDEERKDKTLELKEELNKAQIDNLNRDKGEFAILLNEAEKAGKDRSEVVEMYLESKFGGTQDDDVIKAVAGIAKTLAQDVSFDDTEDVEGYLLNLNKIAKDIFGITQDITSGKSFDIAKNKVTG